jgi:teichoic acid transport system ATP-binding protein
MALAVATRGLRVEFRPYLDRLPTLRKTLAGQKRRATQTVVALDDVSFSLESGGSLAVVGANGAGKSTLLRVLAGTLEPDAGEVAVPGGTPTLLKLGTGFNAELPGRLNVMLAGLAGGLTKNQVREKFDDILEYSGIGDAIERPVKTYSSGMFSRLAFAVAINLEPEIVLLDELLAVGDEAFREKSKASLAALLESGRTLILVSHSVKQLPDICASGLWLDKGRVRASGSSEEVIQQYLAFARGRRVQQRA